MTGVPAGTSGLVGREVELARGQRLVEQALGGLGGLLLIGGEAGIGKTALAAAIVLRPGGRLVVANADEDTRIYSARDRERGRRIERAMADRCRDPWMGRRLAHLLMQAGFRVVRETVACDVEHRFAPGCAGYALAHALRGYLVTHGGIELNEYERWLTDLRESDWAGGYTYAVTTFAYLSVIDIDQGAHHGT